MYICLYDTCADINMSLYVYRDGFWHTSESSFRGGFVQNTSMLTCLRLDGKPPKSYYDPGQYMFSIFG